VIYGVFSAKNNIIQKKIRITWNSLQNGLKVIGIPNRYGSEFLGKLYGS